MNKKQKKLVLHSLWSYYNELDRSIEKTKDKKEADQLLERKMELYDLIVKVRKELYNI